MTLSRRSFLASVAVAPAMGSMLVSPRADQPFALDPQRFEPWIEIHPSSLLENVRVLSRLAGGRPVMAVIKNNGYGLGLLHVARVLETAPGPRRSRCTTCSCTSARACRAWYFDPMTIRILVTGGTFDKQYDEVQGALAFRETNVEHVLARGRCKLDVVVEVLMLVDSLDITPEQRAGIVAACQGCAEDRVVVTHGTDTMVETARALAAGALGTGKTIVITGAMVPYAFGSSDGLFNLGSALSFVQALSPGVYVAMNGHCFAWDNVRKNRESGGFETLRLD